MNRWSGQAAPRRFPDGGGLGQGGNRPPTTEGGVQAQEGAVKRSGRGWKPSVGCLENIAQATWELGNIEGEFQKEERGELPEGVEGSRGLEDQATFEHTFWSRECSFAAQGIELCPRNHSEAMLLPHAQKVREAEISEFNSHVVNGTFGPELEETT